MEDTVFISNINNEETYYSLSFKDKGNIIDFVKNRIELDQDYILFSPEKDHLIEACKKLVEFINQYGEETSKLNISSSSTNMLGLINKAFTTYYKAIPADEITNVQYFKHFGIDPLILSEDLFKDKVYSTIGLILNGKIYNDAVNISFPIVTPNNNNKEIGLYNSNIIKLENKTEEINLFAPGSNKKGFWSSNKPKQHKNTKYKITIVDKPIEALAHYSYIKEPRQYISFFESDENTFENLKYLLNNSNKAVTSIYLSMGISLENFEKEFKLLISLLDIDAKLMMANFNEIKIWFSNSALEYFYDLISAIKETNNKNIATAIKTLGDQAKNHIKNDMILASKDERNNLIIQIPKNFKTLYQFQQILINVMPSKYNINTEKPKYMNWVLQNQKGERLKNSQELVEKEELFLTTLN